MWLLQNNIEFLCMLFTSNTLASYYRSASFTCIPFARLWSWKAEPCFFSVCHFRLLSNTDNNWLPKLTLGFTGCAELSQMTALMAESKWCAQIGPVLSCNVSYKHWHSPLYKCFSINCFQISCEGRIKLVGKAFLLAKHLGQSFKTAFIRPKLNCQGRN